MIDHILRYTVPAAYSLLPPAMASPAATAMLLAIGLQESKFEKRRQMQAVDPALSFWQFERAGVQGVMTHSRSKVHLEAALRALRYSAILREVSACHKVIEHHDPLAFVYARLLLWTHLAKLQTRDQAEIAWNQYMDLWRPGKPHPETWKANYVRAWELVSPIEE